MSDRQMSWIRKCLRSANVLQLSIFGKCRGSANVLDRQKSRIGIGPKRQRSDQQRSNQQMSKSANVAPQKSDRQKSNRQKSVLPLGACGGGRLGCITIWREILKNTSVAIYFSVEHFSVSSICCHRSHYCFYLINN